MVGIPYVKRGQRQFSGVALAVSALLAFLVNTAACVGVAPFNKFRRVAGWQRDMWRFMYRNRLEKLHWAVLEQDRLLLENLAPDANAYEYLYQHDVGLSRLRRMMQKTAKAQVAERETQHALR